MAVSWVNDGEAVNGEYIAVITHDDGSQPQRFKGGTYREVADKLLNAQDNATRRIQQLKKTQAAPVQANSQPHPQVIGLTPDERFQLAHDLTNPAKSEQALTRLLESQGVPLAEVRQIIATQREEKENREALTETEAFVQDTPDWEPSDHNKQTLVNYMQAQNLAATRANFSLAFDNLMEAGLLQRKPDAHPSTETEPEPEPIAPVASRPRSTASTGLRSAQGRSTPPAAPRSKYTRQAIRNMSAAEYKQKLLSEPGFASAVDSAR